MVPAISLKRIAFVISQNGSGHFYRSLALAEKAKSLGNEVAIIGHPVRIPSFEWLPDEGYLLEGGFDWAVIDTPDDPPHLMQNARDKGIKICILNGTERVEDDLADLRIVQGYCEDPDVCAGPDYVILRPEVWEAKRKRSEHVDWFVYGGSGDQMKLTEKFPDWQRYSYGYSHNDLFLERAAKCKRAAIAFGHSAWEFAAIGIPCYCFSLTETHLKFALAANDNGLVKTWPAVGLPHTREAMITFLQQPFQISARPPDGLAAERILQRMEELS